MAGPGGRSSWGLRAAGAYLLLLSATAGFHAYHALFSRPAPAWWSEVLQALAWPWSGTLRFPDPSGPALLVAWAVNTALLYFVASRLERLAGPPR